MEKPSLKKNFILSSVYQILTIATPLLTAPYIARVLGADGTGIYSYTSAYVTYFLIFAALGTPFYGMREIARNRENKKIYSGLFWEIELLSVITTIVCLIGWMVWILINTKYKIYYIILSITLLANIFDVSWFYNGLEQLQNTVYVNSFFKIIGVIFIFVFVKDKNDIALYIMIMSLSVLLGNISMWLFLKRYLEKTKISFKNIKKHFKETLIYFIPTIAISVYTILDKTLIGIITKSEFENGYYEQATKIINMAKAVTFTAINSVMGARISYLFVEKDYYEIKRRIKESIDYILFTGVGIAFGLLGISRRFVPWFFGEGYHNTILLLEILCPIVLIIGISNCLGHQYYTPSGNRTKSAKYIIVGSCLNLILNIVLIPVLKGYGAAIASILAEITVTSLYLKNCDGFLQTSYLLKKIVKKLLAGICMFLFIMIVDGFIKSDTWAILLEVMLGALVYILVLFLIKDNFVRKHLKKLFKFI